MTKNTDELPNAEDFARLESKINDCMRLLSDLAIAQTQATPDPLEVLRVEDVERLYALSPYLQRLARKSGELKYIISGRREITYSRLELEAFLRRRTLN